VSGQGEGEFELSADPRLANAIELLRSVLEQSEQDPTLAPAVGQLPFVPPPFSETTASATDLLSWWFRPAATTAAAWDDYFGMTPVAEVIAAPPASVRQATWRPPAREKEPEPPIQERLSPWITLQALLPSPQDELPDEHAEAAAETLYGFIHAVGRRDIEAAMDLVADDYHTLEDDREIDRLGLRHQLEALLDSLQGWEIETSLLTVPEPLSYPGGILIFAEIQVDARRVPDGMRRCIIIRRVVLLEQVAGRGWLIAGLSPV
jgi:hypothetical protein